MATQVPTSRGLRDKQLSITKALPSTSGNNTSDTIDLGAGPFNPEEITVEISFPAMPLHVTTGNLVVISLYSAATTSVTTITQGSTLTFVMSLTLPGVASSGSVAQVGTFKLPAGTLRYIGFHQVCGATDDLSSYTMTYTILQ